MAHLRPWFLPQQEVCLRSVSGTIPGLRAYLFKDAGGLRNSNRIDQNEGLLRHPADCPRLFEGNKVKEKKDTFTGQ